MTGKELFETEQAPHARRDRADYRTFEQMPVSLQDWWNERAKLPQFRDLDGPVLAWAEIKAAARIFL